MIPLGNRQQATIAAALTILSAAIIVAALLGLGWLVVTFAQRFSNVFLPVAVGAVAALVFRPYYAVLHTRLRLPHPLALAAVFLSILLPIVAFGWFFGAIIVDQVQDLVVRIPDLWQRGTELVQDRLPKIQQFLQENPWGQRIRDALTANQSTLLHGLQAAGGTALSAGRGILGSIAGLLSWAVFPVYFAFFMMADTRPTDHLEEQLPFLKPSTRKTVVYLVRQFFDIVVAFFRGQLVIAFLQGMLFAVGFSVVGLKYGFILGLMLGLLNIIPYLGSMVGLGIGLPLGWFQPGGGWGVVVGTLVVFTLVQLIEGYVLTPRIMGDRTGLHPMAIIIAVFFWGSALNGILGMILAIPLTAFLVLSWRLARDYIVEIV